MMETNKIFGYIRVSSKDQNLDRQKNELLKYVKNERDIFCDKQSGKNFDRPGYQNLKYILRKNDELYIHDLSRLGRNKEAIKNELLDFQKKQIRIHILNIPTTLIDFTAFGNLQKAIFDMVNNILVEVLSTMAENERYTILKAQKEGIVAAHKKGVKFGRPNCPYPLNWAEDYIMWKNKKCTAISLIKKHNLNASTFYRLVKRWENTK